MRVYYLMIFLHSKVIRRDGFWCSPFCSALKVASKVKLGAKFVSQRMSTHSRLRHGLGRKRFA